MTDRTIDVEKGVKLATEFARDELKKPTAYLETFSQTVRAWLAAGGHGRISFNADGTKKEQ